MDSAPNMFASPRRTREKQSVQAQLGKMIREQELLRQENFDLKLQIHHLINSRHEPRRGSATPPPDDFYGQENKDDNHDEQDAIIVGLDTLTVEKLNNQIRDLKLENNDLREENDECEENIAKLHECHDDLMIARDRAVDEMERMEEKVKLQNEEMESLVNQADEMASINLQLKLETQSAQEQLDTINLQLHNSTQEIEKYRRKEQASRVKAEGLSMQMKAMADALEKQKDEATTALDKMGQCNVNIARLEKQLAEKSIQLGNVGAKMKDLEAEKEGLRVGLEREREKSGIWHEVDMLAERGDRLFEGEGHMGELMNVLKQQQEKWQSTEFVEGWRDMVMADMNECLKALYRAEREVEAKRQVVGERLFGMAHDHEVFATPMATVPRTRRLRT